VSNTEQTSSATATPHAFQADVSRLLHLMVHSIYSDRDIFVRELISNGADACEKLRYEALTHPGLIASDEGFSIRIAVDAEKKLLTFTDNGIGMNHDELIGALGTIASSGTRAFLDKLAQSEGGDEAAPRGSELIELLPKIDVLAVNRMEAEALVPQLAARFGEDRRCPAPTPGTRLPRLLARGLIGGGHEMGLCAFADAMNRLGCRAVLLTDGSDGAYLGTDGALLHCPARKVEVAGTAGAGDALASTFAAWWFETGSPADALRAATINAASVVRHVDTQTGLLGRSAMTTQIAEHMAALPVARWALGGGTG
jgi:hydroxymethylpyrimidine/phosphomethylpyrimidine kinase